MKLKKKLSLLLASILFMNNCIYALGEPIFNNNEPIVNSSVSESGIVSENIPSPTISYGSVSENITTEDTGNISDNATEQEIVSESTYIDNDNAESANGNIVESGYCGGEGDGSNVIWQLDNGGNLLIIGSGKMCENDPNENYGYLFGDDILKRTKKIMLSGEITSIPSICPIYYIEEGWGDYYHIIEGFSEYNDFWYIGNEENPYFALIEMSSNIYDSNNTNPVIDRYIHPDTHIIVDNINLSYSPLVVPTQLTIHFGGNEARSINLIASYISEKNDYHPTIRFSFINSDGHEEIVYALGYCGAAGNEDNIIWKITLEKNLVFSQCH